MLKNQRSCPKLKSNLFYTTYICKLKITNNSNRELNNVFLNINSVKGYFKINEIEDVKGSEGYSEQRSDFLESIEIGKIEPKESVEITVWIEKPVKKERFRLTHSGNMLEIDFEEYDAL